MVYKDFEQKWIDGFKLFNLKCTKNCAFHCEGYRHIFSHFVDSVHFESRMDK